MSSRRLAGRVAFVTGGGRGVGRAIAEALAADGASVGLCARTEAQVTEVANGIRARGGKAVPLAVDVTDRAAVEQAVAGIEDKLGAISLLVNNAGTFDSIGPLWEIDPDMWWGDVEVHVRGTLLCTHAVLSSMIPRREGRIINVLGLLGQFGEPYVSAYASAKAALFRLTECLANEVRDHEVRVFSISPGSVRTQMTSRFVEDDAARELVPAFAEMPVGDWVSADKGAELVVRLARGEGDVLSGRFIHVTDDLARLLAISDEIESGDRLKMRLLRG